MNNSFFILFYLYKPSTLQNESINGHHKNVKFVCADVTSPDLKISDESVDLIFSNWLLMYLSDKEVRQSSSLMFMFFLVKTLMFMFEESFSHQKMF